LTKTIKRLTLLIFISIIGIWGINYYVRTSTSPLIYSSAKQIPAKPAALLLGTAKYVAHGQQNYFYLYRIRAAVRLWKAGKIKAIIVSGDNGTKYYDEATAMYEDLIRAGVPARYITRDYAGFRTLDSVIRARAVFGLNDFIIITQRFHLERALYIARAKGIQAIGYLAKDLPHTAAAYRMRAREYLARTKAFLDLYILGTDPKFYGKKEKVHYRK
jgi:SanA protein